MSLATGERVVEREYLAALENKLKALNDSERKATAEQLLSDFVTYRDQQLFRLITSGDYHSQGFEDDFTDAAITVNFLRRLIAPQTCAISKQELLHLVKNDHVQKLHEAVAEDRDSEELKSKGVEITNMAINETKNRMIALPLELPISDIEVSFSEQSFLPFTEANHLFIIHKNASGSREHFDAPLSIHTCLINVYGQRQFVEENQTIFLPHLLRELSLPSATVWVELNEHFCLCRHFGALFVLYSTIIVRMTGKTNDLSPIARCRLTDKIIYSVKCKHWILCKTDECLSAYNIDKDFNLNCSVGTHNLFPELELLGLPGAVTRSSSIFTDKLHWTALGCDSGHVVLSVFCKESQTLLRKLIKFSGPISALMFLDRASLDSQKLVKDGNLNYHDEEFLVISSTLGPVAVWKCFYEARYNSTPLTISDEDEYMAHLRAYIRRAAFWFFDEFRTDQTNLKDQLCFGRPGENYREAIIEATEEDPTLIIEGLADFLL
ncbi:hypothetical protein KIN20_017980 [Parelaphostrongylus tenuis]|uniref:Uncharacterized protein n=1 Tax=Parelaphostrongylus tenuis TaxID=148309 RepID=A0AAD5QRT3_PARTN|nr:hypothetical protein KIN20_017980 [Parelaphostrongylus tenuis]